MIAMSNVTTTASSSVSADSLSTTPDPNAYCRSTQWHILLGTSLGTYITLLVVISISHILCKRSLNASDGDTRELLNRKRVTLVARLHLYGMTLMKGSNTLGKVLLVIYSICVIASFVIYILLTYQLTDIQTQPVESRTLLVCNSASQFPVVHLDFAINLFYILIFLIRLASSYSVQSFWLSIDTIADHVTIIPSVIMYAMNKHMIVFQFARLCGLKFLVNALIYCNILRVEKYIRLVSLLIRIISIWAISAGLFQLIESVGDFWRIDNVTNSVFLQYHDCFYYMLITMSTIGYGDIYPHTVLGKFFIIIFIIVALGTFTSIIPEVSDILTEKKKYEERENKQEK